jgi:hypothetical protein
LVWWSASKAAFAAFCPLSNAVSTSVSSTPRMSSTSFFVVSKIPLISATTRARSCSSFDCAAPWPAATCCAAPAFAAVMAWMPVGPAAAAPPCSAATRTASAARNCPGAVAACSSEAFFASSASANLGSLELASCSGVSLASAIMASVSLGPVLRSVCSGGAGATEAALGSGGASVGGAGWPGSGVTGFSTAFDSSGAFAVFSVMSLAEPSLPALT